jgi:hypothetical protein
MPPKKMLEKSQILVLQIIFHINNNTPQGFIIKNNFFRNFGEEIDCARTSGGERSHHFDFEIKIKGKDEWKKVEHKGSVKYKKIENDTRPWKTGVQFFNGTGSLFSIGKKYSRNFYDMFIGNRYVSDKYNICSEIPPYEEWANSIFKQSKITTIPFINELREKKVNNKPARLKGLYEERNIFTKKFNECLTEEDKTLMQKEVLEIANNAFLEKHYWIQLHGDLEKDFRVKWSPQMRLESFEGFVIDKSCDCKYTLECGDGLKITALLRWGYNHGISNLRMDLK